MAKFYYDDTNHPLKEISAFDIESAKKQADNFWNIFSKADEVNSATLYDENLEPIKEYNKC